MALRFYGSAPEMLRMVYADLPVAFISIATDEGFICVRYCVTRNPRLSGVLIHLMDAVQPAPQIVVALVETLEPFDRLRKC